MRGNQAYSIPPSPASLYQSRCHQPFLCSQCRRHSHSCCHHQPNSLLLSSYPPQPPVPSLLLWLLRLPLVAELPSLLQPPMLYLVIKPPSIPPTQQTRTWLPDPDKFMRRECRQNSHYIYHIPPSTSTVSSTQCPYLQKEILMLQIELQSL
jgi:hypothetical protein